MDMVLMCSTLVSVYITVEVYTVRVWMKIHQLRMLDYYVQDMYHLAFRFVFDKSRCDTLKYENRRKSYVRVMPLFLAQTWEEPMGTESADPDMLGSILHGVWMGKEF